MRSWPIQRLCRRRCLLPVSQSNYAGDLRVAAHDAPKLVPLTERPLQSDGNMPEESSAFLSRLRELALAEVETHALVFLDPQGVIVGWLAGAERLFGYTADEIVGQDVSILFTPEDLQKGLSRWEQMTASYSGESEDDRWQVRKDGGRIWVSGTLTALRDAQGELVGFAKIMRNRTDQKSQVETLENQARFFQQAAQRKDAFISTLAHELRNPLAALTNAAYLLKECEKVSPDLAMVVAMIRRQTEFMGGMINDLLDVARTAAGKVALRKERVVLQEIIQNAIETCRPSIDARAQVLQSLTPDVAVALDADPVRLRQILVNLIENASKYSSSGGRIWVKATVEGDDAVVRVIDTGIGIDPEVMPHIFDLFTQAETDGASPGGQSPGGQSLVSPERFDLA
jgi:PAS domain S-box-containing protein